MAQALNIEGIDSSIVLLVAGSGLAEPGVDILVQQRVGVQAWPSWISVGANHF
jgi:predicted naringenin-chalcone synthase